MLQVLCPLTIELGQSSIFALLFERRMALHLLI